MADFVPGRELAGAFYEEVVAPAVAKYEHAAALIGFGSDVFGFDSVRSTDHGWGPRFQLFVAADQIADASRDVTAALPDIFRGWPTRFGWDEVAVGHQIEIAEVGTWLTGRLGVDPTGGLTTTDWLSMPHQRLAEVTQGPVFHDDSGMLARVRSELAWYPNQVWLYVLASQWRRVAQEQAFVGRTAEAGDELGSRIVAARLVRDLMRLCFLLDRRYPPYSKWLGTAFGELAAAHALRPVMERALAAATYAEREAALVAAYRLLGEQQNVLAITPRVDPEPRPFYGRPYLVSPADDFVAACLSGIDDPGLTALAPVGSVDQFADSTDVLARPRAAFAVTRALLGDEDQVWRR
jgi:Domain of unknown function (DUF4037)